MIWTFDDLLDASGESVIEQWFGRIGVEAEAFIERRLKDMGAQFAMVGKVGLKVPEYRPD